MARANYFSLDRPDISYATKEACRYMSKPTDKDERRAKRIGRYLKEHRRVVQQFGWQDDGEEVKVMTDSDWAGCERSRKSTSGGVIMHGRHCIKYWSKTQQTVAMSSGEAELMAVVKGCCEGIGVQEYMNDAGIEKTKLGIYTDASAAIGIAQRFGLGRTRHIDVSMLWIQQKQWKKRFEIAKIDGKKKTADLFTKHVPQNLAVQQMNSIGFQHREGRAAKAVEVVK